MSDAGDAEALLARLSERWGPPSHPLEMASTVAAAIADARNAVPGLAFEVSVLGDGLVRALAAQDEPWAGLAEVHWEDMLVTAESLRGSSAALRLFEARYFSGLRRQIGRRVQVEADREEVEQTVREKVLSQHDRTLAYAARGALQTLINLIAARSAIDLHRRNRARPDQGSADAQMVETLLDSGLSAELLAAKRRHHSTFKAAFEAAVAGLSPQGRGLLRLSLLQRLSVTEVAALQNVHRATAARRIARVRDKLAERVRRELRFASGLSDTELRSLHHALDSQLELSLSRVLVPEGHAPDE